MSVDKERMRFFDDLMFIKMNVGFFFKRGFFLEEVVSYKKMGSFFVNIVVISSIKMEIKVKSRLRRSWLVIFILGYFFFIFRSTICSGYSFGRFKLSRNVWGYFFESI